MERMRQDGFRSGRAFFSASGAGASNPPEGNFDWEQKDSLGKIGSASADSALPRVLILGDSISVGYTPIVAEMLKDEAVVTRPEANCGPSEFYLEYLKEWLGNGGFDVIHVNFGIWDNHYMTPDGEILFESQHPEYMRLNDPAERDRAIRADGCRIRTPEPEYEKNMRTILSRLKTAAGTVIFGLSTPMPVWKGDCRMARIPVYNGIAERVCAELGVAVNDLYSVGLAHLDLQCDGCHFHTEGYRFLAEAVSGKIREFLKK